MEIILLSGLGTAALLVTELYTLAREKWARRRQAARCVPLRIEEAARCLGDTVTIMIH
jgi:hypothetical protein